MQHRDACIHSCRRGAHNRHHQLLTGGCAVCLQAHQASRWVTGTKPRAWMHPRGLSQGIPAWPAAAAAAMVHPADQQQVCLAGQAGPPPSASPPRRACAGMHMQARRSAPPAAAVAAAVAACTCGAHLCLVALLGTCCLLAPAAAMAAACWPHPLRQGAACLACHMAPAAPAAAAGWALGCPLRGPLSWQRTGAWQPAWA